MNSLPLIGAIDNFRTSERGDKLSPKLRPTLSSDPRALPEPFHRYDFTDLNSHRDYDVIVSRVCRVYHKKGIQTLANIDRKHVTVRAMEHFDCGGA